MVVKNYKEMCKLLEEKEKSGGDSKKCQLKNWKRFFTWENQGQKFIIKEIYDEPLQKEDGRSKGQIRIKQKSFAVSNDEAHKSGVYKIENDKYIYIGSTIRYFTLRFSQHFYNYDGNHNKTQEVLNNNGTFVCLRSFEVGTDEKIIRECEAEYIRKYRNCKKELLNDTIPELLSGEEKIQYKQINIPEEYFEEIKNILIENGFLILKNTVFNKKFEE